MALPQSVKTQKGYSLLAVVFIVGMTGFSVALLLSSLSVKSADSSRVVQASQKAKAGALACAELGLQAVRENSNFSGYVSDVAGENNCGYQVILGSGQHRTIQASSTVESTSRKVEVTIDSINPRININSWQEVDNY